MGENSLNTADWLSGGPSSEAPSLQGLVEEQQRRKGARTARNMSAEDREAHFQSRSGLDFLDLSPWGGRRTVGLNRLATEVVLYGEDAPRMSEAYGLESREYLRMLHECVPLRREIENVRKAIGPGDVLQARFRDLAVSSFDILTEIIFNSDEKGLVRLKAIEMAARYGGLEPARTSEGGQQQAVQVVINGADAATGLAVRQTPMTRDDREKAVRMLEQRARDLEEEHRQKLSMSEEQADQYNTDDEEDVFPS